MNDDTPPRLPPVAHSDTSRTHSAADTATPCAPSGSTEDDRAGEPAAAATSQPNGGGDDQGGRAGRRWSTRRVPAAVVAAVLAAGAGILCYDLVSVRAGGTAMAWRRTLARELASQQLDSAVVLAAASVAVLVGLWLVVLAATPGRRGLLAMRRHAPDVAAHLHRDAATRILRDRAIAVTGVQSATVRVGRRKVRARAIAHFRDMDAVRGDLDAALENGIHDLGLARHLGLAVRVHRADRPRKGR